MENDIFWSETIESGFGEPGGKPSARIPRGISSPANRQLGSNSYLQNDLFFSFHNSPDEKRYIPYHERYPWQIRRVAVLLSFVGLPFYLNGRNHHFVLYVSLDIQEDRHKEHSPGLKEVALKRRQHC